MPQVKRSLEIVYAVNPFGADHQSSEHDPGYTSESSDYSLARLALLGLTEPQPDRVMNREKARLALLTMYNYSFMDSANLCQFVYGPSWQLLGPNEMAELASAVTGWPLTVADIQMIGERRLNLTRAFNAREGAGRDRDTLPAPAFRAAARRRIRRVIAKPRGAGAGAERLLRTGRLGPRDRQSDPGDPRKARSGLGGGIRLKTPAGSTKVVWRVGRVAAEGDAFGARDGEGRSTDA